jgi:hypothetical protein
VVKRNLFHYKPDQSLAEVADQVNFPIFFSEVSFLFFFLIFLVGAPIFIYFHTFLNIEALQENDDIAFRAVPSEWNKRDTIWVFFVMAGILSLPKGVVPHYIASIKKKNRSIISVMICWPSTEAMYVLLNKRRIWQKQRERRKNNDIDLSATL